MHAVLHSAVSIKNLHLKIHKFLAFCYLKAHKMSSFHKDGNTHYNTCIYKNCNINNRQNVLNVRFYHLPIEDRERLITWLINCDDFAEESDAELRKFRICSRHFPTNII